MVIKRTRHAKIFASVACALAIFVLLPLSAIAFLTPESTRAAGIAVPFVLQAPHSRWVQPYEDACEEAVMVMLDAYFKHDTRDRMPANEADKRILDIVALERRVLGYDKDTNAGTIMRLINEHFSFEAYLVRDPSIAVIKEQIDQGLPVVIPAWGRTLMKSNPYFTRPGPTYHTLLITGYDDTKQEFITQEPGVGRGRNFRYPYALLMSAMQDLVQDAKGRPIQGGERLAIFVVPGQGFPLAPTRGPGRCAPAPALARRLSRPSNPFWINNNSILM